ncbi:winged helix-turn-helix transcriptional regulator [Companilactobacillus sp. DQM5]|uniref:winged helix-turn-helix transcriptional regulator n=1 Tax=Companilactobacillus sp. DQM5 TaxID=3463359 RepID=UPI0040583E40
MTEKIYNIGVEATIDIIGGKWKPIILCHLRNVPLRTNELMKKIPNISQKVLTQQLRELEEDDIITRHVFQEVPPHVEYQLSEYGESLNKILNLLCVWGENDIDRRHEKGEDITILNRDSV